jgi:hypothetical protein
LGGSQGEAWRDEKGVEEAQDQGVCVSVPTPTRDPSWTDACHRDTKQRERPTKRRG